MILKVHMEYVIYKSDVFLGLLESMISIVDYLSNRIIEIEWLHIFLIIYNFRCKEMCNYNIQYIL